MPTSPTLSKIPLSDARSQQWLTQWANAVYTGEEPPTLDGYAIPTSVAMQFLLAQFPTRLQQMHIDADLPENDVFVPKALLARAYRGILLLDKQQEQPQFDSNAIQRTWAHVQKPYLEDWKKYGQHNRPIMWQSDFGSLIDVELTREDFQELKAFFKNDEVDQAWYYVYAHAAQILADEIKQNPLKALEELSYQNYKDMLEKAYVSTRQEVVDSWKTDKPVHIVFGEDFSLACETPSAAGKDLEPVPFTKIMPVVSDENEKFFVSLSRYLQEKSRQMQQELGLTHKTDFKIKTQLNDIGIGLQDKIKKLAKPWYWENLKEASLEEQAEMWAWTTTWAKTDKWEPLLNNMSIFPGVEEIGTKGYTGKDEYWWTITPFAEKLEESLKWMGPARETLKEQEAVNYLDDFFSLTGAR